MQNILSLEDALAILKKNAPLVTETEEVDLLAALDRKLAADYVAAFNNPPFDRSPLDGYTFNSAAVQNASKDKPCVLNIIGEECAGDFFSGEVPLGAAVRIMTGGAIPAGCDCVVRQEDVTSENGTLKVFAPLKHHENYCFAGEDIKKGTVLAKQGEVLTPAHIGALASMGYAKVKVYRKIKITLASTGDELMPPGEPLTNGKIYNSNLYIIASRLQEMGFSPEVIGILPDDVNKASEVIKSYAAKTDIFITTGGVSVGKKDIMHGVADAVGTKLFWRVSMKPGGPALAYTIASGTHKTLGIALSGNPFAAYATFELIVREVLFTLTGNKKLQGKITTAILADAFPKKSLGRRFIRARYENDRLYLPAQHASGSLFSVVGCNAFIDIAAGTDALAAGSRVKAIIFR